MRGARERKKRERGREIERGERERRERGREREERERREKESGVNVMLDSGVTEDKF